MCSIPEARLAKIADVLDVAIEKLNIDRTVQSRVKRQMEKAQKEYYLNEKIKAIQKELGRGEKSEFDELKKKIESAGMPKDVLEKSLQELKKLEAMPPMSAESHGEPQLPGLAAGGAVEEALEGDSLD